MLTPDQQDRLLLSLFATAEAMQQQLTPAAAQLMVQDLAAYDEPVLTAALQAVRREGGRFTVAAVLKHAEAADGRPAANEAWAIALQGYDEAETVLLTPEIQQAAAAAAPIFDAGDDVGARMAFIAAYDRLVGAARQLAQPVAWTLSLGHDAERRVLAIESAKRLGRLPAPVAQQLLLQHGGAPQGEDGRAIAGLLTQDVVEASPKVRNRLDEIRQGLETHRREQQQERLAERGESPEGAMELLQRRASRSEALLGSLLEAQKQGDSLIEPELRAIAERVARAEQRHAEALDAIEQLQNQEASHG
ncbi:hypothetical protein VV867_08935 [Pseudomonas sp. JH-2]|uniref:hypothetical protein n=1 Tax=Pseudomonas sp. JH-2 TaxID=3114998 RepID=UPI002E25CBB8|nr:hypothetical protein [Pseudomonas sp. JH-2]